MKKTFVLSVLTLLLPSLLLAHPGHDHQSAWSPLMHLLWVLPVVLVAVSLSSAKLRSKLTVLATKRGQ